FALIKLQNLTETEFTIVPFKGSAPARTALMGGHVAMGILNISEVAEFQDSLNVLGVATNERSEFAPDLPTFKEQGLELVNGSMRGFIAPAGLPDDVQEKLLAAFTQLKDDPDFLKSMKDTANPVEVVTGDDFKALTKDLHALAQDVWEKTPWN
ncbi:MAG: tripartite tricarboxylate transporter substrate binding protein, partial [Rhodobacteraceae bacterium]|nr:tripartite tricarboxylate transporter substrate binding protein [Paracoccaceae bacterium]